MRLWQSGFMHPVSTGNYGGSSPPGRASARSFNGRTLDFGPNYECSIHSLAAKFLVRRHSTVGWPPYKGSTWVRLPAPQPCVIRVRSSRRGADIKPVLISGQAEPSRRPRVKDEQAALNRQAVSSILTGRTKWKELARYSDGASEPRPSGSRSKIPGLWLNGEALDF